MISKVYASDESAKKIIRYLELKLQAPSLSLRASISSPETKMSSRVALGLTLLHVCLGHTVLLLYSTELFKVMMAFSDSDNFVSARTASIVIGVFNLVALFPAAFFLDQLGRRTLMVCGCLVITLCHTLIGLFALSSNDWGVTLFMAFFALAFQLANGPVAWVYCREIATDAVFRACHSLMWASTLALALLGYPLILGLRPQGLFWVLAVLALAGAFLTHKHVMETFNLTEEQKRTVYAPDLPMFDNRLSLLAPQAGDEKKKSGFVTLNLDE